VVTASLSEWGVGFVFREAPLQPGAELFPAGNNGVVGISRQRPEAQSARRDVWARMAAQVSFGEKGASIVSRLFYAISGIFAIRGDLRPNVENVGFGKRRKRVTAHLLVERSSRQASFMDWISR